MRLAASSNRSHHPQQAASCSPASVGYSRSGVLPLLQAGDSTATGTSETYSGSKLDFRGNRAQKLELTQIKVSNRVNLRVTWSLQANERKGKGVKGMLADT